MLSHNSSTDSSETLPNADLTLQQERAELEIEIGKLEVTLANLKRKRNALISIGKIPTDILLKVFESVLGHDRRLRLGLGQLTFFQNDIKQETDAEIWSIKAMTHVCSLWRDLALDSPSLWSLIRLNSKHDIILEKLNRSQPTSLTISCVHFDAFRSHFRELDAILSVPSQLQRIKHLELGFPYASFKPLVERLTVDPPHNLESCVFVASNSQTFPVIKLPIKLLRYSSKTLRCLRMSRCNFEFDGINGTIHLPNLSRLALNGHEPIALLSRLSFPPTCLVTLSGGGSLDEDDSSSHDLRLAIQRIWGPQNAGPDCQFHALTIHLTKAYQASPFTLATKHSPENLVIWQYSLGYFTFRHWLGVLLLDNIRTLRVDLSLPPAVWGLLDQYCPNIIRLSLNEDDIAYWFQTVLYIRGLNEPPPSSISGGELPTPCFLKLEVLEYTGRSLAQFSHYTALGDCLKQRHEMGRSLKSLTLPNIPTVHLKELAQYVDGEIISNE
ncbi:hypothetical protein BDN72DRAFT_965534 [Pluteus cervinus]|uniref:Uncharacterized protein n=1 Tax=Pluteus cervinus TaxID=181527 RepID=A0ACD3A5D4_9AGAR|nr:hypothetical protein BDN72DRAFT_965534 [Pluteus cervinus]